MYALSPSQIPYAYFPDAFIYVPSLIENLIFEVIILIDVCHFDQAVAHRCFVRTILLVSLSPSISPCWPSVMFGSKTIKYLPQTERKLVILSHTCGRSYNTKNPGHSAVWAGSISDCNRNFILDSGTRKIACYNTTMLLFFLLVTCFRLLRSRKMAVYSTRFLLNSWQLTSSIQHKLYVSPKKINLVKQ